MTAMVATPPFSYAATAIRPKWEALPGDVREAITERLGSEVIAAAPAGGGFTSGFAAVLTTATGERSFVKAARAADQRHLCDWYAHEALVTAALPPEIRAPRPRWTLADHHWFILCTEAIDGHVPPLPWQPQELAETLETWATAAEALANPPRELRDLDLPPLDALINQDLQMWTEIARGNTPLPAFAEHARPLIPALAALESKLPALAATAGEALMHCDLRLDNVLIDTKGRAWLCDWNWLCHGPAWFDTVVLLITAHASDLNATQLWETHPTAANAPDGALDAALAAMSGYCLTRAASPPNDAAPLVRAHQRWTGEQALAWLLTRNPTTA
jgi:aminoglycoside phosphotransferase (APT) family kinase protein